MQEMDRIANYLTTKFALKNVRLDNDAASPTRSVALRYIVKIIRFVKFTKFEENRQICKNHENRANYEDRGNHKNHVNCEIRS